MAKSASTNSKPAVDKKTSDNKDKAGESKTPPAKVKHIVTDEDLTKNPDLVTQGVKVGDEIEIDAPALVEGAEKGLDEKTSGKGADAPAKKSIKDKMKIYQEHYPENKVFYITSDGQVFLETNKADAEAHQKTLGAGELETFE